MKKVSKLPYEVIEISIFQKKIESVDTLFLKIHQQMAELQQLRCKKSEN